MFCPQWQYHAKTNKKKRHTRKAGLGKNKSELYSYKAELRKTSKPENKNRVAGGNATEHPKWTNRGRRKDGTNRTGGRTNTKYTDTLTRGSGTGEVTRGGNTHTGGTERGNTHIKTQDTEPWHHPLSKSKEVSLQIGTNQLQMTWNTLLNTLWRNILGIQTCR